MYEQEKRDDVRQQLEMQRMMEQAAEKAATKKKGKKKGNRDKKISTVDASAADLAAATAKAEMMKVPTSFTYMYVNE